MIDASRPGVTFESQGAMRREFRGHGSRQRLKTRRLDGPKRRRRMKDLGSETMRPSFPRVHLLKSVLQAGLVPEFAER